MNGYLLDTVTLSELRRPALNRPVQRWLEEHASANLYLSVVTLGEIRKGIDRLPAGNRRTDLEIWFAAIRERFSKFSLNIDAQVAMLWGTLLAPFRAAGRQEPTIDAVIAATALVHNLIVVTRNVRDFEEFGVATVNPWEDGKL